MAFADNSFITWKKYAVIILGIILFIMSGCDNDKSSDKPSSKRPKDPNSVTLETDSFRYVIGLDGKNKQFIDKKTATDYCSHTAESYCAQVKLGGKDYTVSSVSQDGSKIILKFSEPGISVVLTTTEHENYVEIEVESIEGGDAESLVFVNIPLTLGGRPEDPFGICAFSLNKFTHVMQLPALQKHPRASCYKRFGMIGAKVALIGVPVDTMLTVLKELVTNAGDLPKTTVSGPWADEIPFNHGSYLFNFGDLTLNTVDDWIAMAKSLGVTQIDNHGGGENFFRFGDFELNRKKWPNGWDDYKEIVARLHKAGIGSIFHTYCFFIDKKSKYVTPVPHPQLDAFRSFELKVPLSKDATEITVVESTENMSTITGFFVHNSITLHIDDELVTFGGFTKKAPYKFTGCTRGAFGTKAASHSKGAKARHLKECFGLFVPDAESELYEEIAKNHADVINYCDFDGIYLDAIDGTSILRGGEDAWYYGSKFLFDIWKHLEKPVGMEMSAMWHHFWQFRSRWQAWDYPTRGQKQFIDIHANAVNSGLLLPLHLGWWNFQTFTPPQVEPTFPDVIEYLGCKMIGFNAGISLTGAINKDNLNKIPAHRRSVGILKRYEQLRRSNIFDESVKKRLREPGKDFTLFMDSEKKWKFRPIHYDKHKIEGVNHPTSAWEAENTFHRQPVKLRIEALMSAGSYNDTVNVVLADFSDSKNFAENIHAEGVTSSLQPSSEQMKSGELSGYFTALNSGKVNQNGAWAKSGKKFDPWLDLGKNQALGVWIYGDGQGELLNFRVGSPQHIAYGAIADRYVMIDFKGWRYFELIETESTRHDNYGWPEAGGSYHVYRESVNFNNIESLSIWYNNLPQDKEIRCYISPVKALPMVERTITNPSITINGKTIIFPFEMRSGSYLEFEPYKKCKLFNATGFVIYDVEPEGEIPFLESGNNKISFTCDETDGINPRANVTVISYGDPF